MAFYVTHVGPPQKGAYLGKVKAIEAEYYTKTSEHIINSNCLQLFYSFQPTKLLLAA